MVSQSGNNGKAGLLEQGPTGTGSSQGADGSSKPTVSQVLGEMTWLLTQSPAHKHFSIADLEWMVMPAILLEQFRIFHGDSTPVGFALWAYLSADQEQRLMQQIATGAGARIRPDDWKSGDSAWLIELVTPFATAENNLNEVCIADLKANVFQEKPFSFFTLDPASGQKKRQVIK